MATSFIKVVKRPNLKAFTDQKKQAIKRTLDRELHVAVTEIDARTQGGTDMNGAPFAPYSESYRKWRARRGYSTTPNLTVRGQMLQAMDVEPTQIVGSKIIAAIKFNSAREAEKASFNQRIRKFFGLARNQISRITAALQAALKS